MVMMRIDDGDDDNGTFHYMLHWPGHSYNFFHWLHSISWETLAQKLDSHMSFESHALKIKIIPEQNI